MCVGLGRKAAKQSSIPNSLAMVRAYSAPPLLHRYKVLPAASREETRSITVGIGTDERVVNVEIYDWFTHIDNCAL